MNVIIPIGGKGERFVTEGFPSPKHMIRVLEKPMISHVLDMMDSEDSITIVYNRQLDSQKLFQNLIETKYRHVKLVPIDNQTEGAAETVLFGISKSMNHKRTVLFDCDTFQVPDVIQKVRNHDGNGVVYFNQDPNENKACYSYIAMDNDFNVVKVREKERISNCANSGIYIFEDSCVLQKYIEQVMTKNLRFRNEQQISSVIQAMLDDGHSFKGICIPETHMISLGTPFALTQQITNVHAFLFDLDGTLVESDSVYQKVWSQLISKQQPHLNYTKDFQSHHIAGQSDTIVLKNLDSHISTQLIADISAEKDDLFLQNLSEVVPIHGALNFVRNIRLTTSHKVAIVTNCNRKVAQAIVDKFQIDIDLLVIGNECKRPKPQSDPYQFALDTFQISPERAIVFEDSPSGLLSAHNVFPKTIVQVASSNQMKHEYADLYVNSYANLDTQTLIHVSDPKLVLIRKQIKDSLTKEGIRTKHIQIAKQKLKGGFIADVLQVDLILPNQDKIECVYKMQNTNEETVLSKMAISLGLYEREYLFYEKVRPLINVHAPKCYAIIQENNVSQGVLLERLDSSDQDINLDLANEDISVTLKVIERMAAMHAKFLGTQEFPELKKNDDPLFCPSWTLFVREKWPEFQKRWSHFLTDAHIQIGNKIVESFDQIQKRLSNPKESLTLIHGDIKSPNIFYRKTDFEPFFIDWQQIALGKGTQDFVFFLIESFPSHFVKQHFSSFQSVQQNRIKSNSYPSYSQTDFHQDILDSACQQPFFVAMWFGCMNSEDLIDQSFPGVFVEKLFSFLTLVQ